MSASKFVQDLVVTVAPIWLAKRLKASIGYSFLLGCATFFDKLIDQSIEGVQAAWPGVGTSTALSSIGRTRGIVQGRTETNDHYAGRLRLWIETHANDRTVQLALQLHEFLPGNPKVTIISRAKPAGYLSSPQLPHWIIVSSGGVVTQTDDTFDWDSVSNPERVGNWSDMWIAIYLTGPLLSSTPYSARSGTLGGLTGDDGFGLGLYAPNADTQDARAIVAEWKGSHSRIRAVIWSVDPDAFTPGGPNNPDGEWGQWSNVQAGNASRVASHRNLTTCRIWEPN